MKLAIAFVLLGSVQSFYLQNDLRTLECNEVLNKEGVYILPKGVICDMIITNEQRVLVELWSAENGDCGKIKFIDESGNEESLCLPSKTNGFGRRYILHIDGLDSDVELSLSYIPKSFVCPGRIDADLFDIPFNITSDGSAACPFALQSTGFLNLRLFSSKLDEPVRVEIRQGRHITNLAMSTGLIPLHMETIRLPLFCGVHVVLIYGPPSTVEAVLQPANPQKYDEFVVRRILDCPL